MDSRNIVLALTYGFLLVLSACSSKPPPPATYSVSGTVNIEPNSFIDSDVNDSYAPSQYHISNNSPGTAQQIENPAKVGGYANVANNGHSGSSFASGDVDDYYKVDLATGENIRLYIADAASGNLNLRLIGSDQTTVLGSSNNGTSVEELVGIAACTGCYIHVEAVSGYSNYLLAVGNTGIATAYDPQDIFYDNFVPDELIVRFKSDSQVAATYDHFQQTTGITQKSSLYDRTALLGFSGQRDLVLKKLGVTQGGKQAFGIASTNVSAEAQAKRETLQVLKALRARDDIVSVDVNYIRKPMALPTTNTYYDKLWHYNTINMPAVWTEGSISGAGTIVAVIDTGVRLNHPDLVGQFSADGGYDFISDPANALDYNGIDSNPDDPGDALGTPYRSSFHGTHVAGTIAAADNSLGIVGVAHGARIMPLRVLGKYGGTDADIIQAIRYAARLSNSSGGVPALKADVINMSLGGPGSSTAFQDTVTAARNQGVIIIAAAGNESSSVVSYPAGYSGVVAVSAVDQNKALAPYSNYGSWVDVAAPGGNTSADEDGDGNPDGVLSTLADDSGPSIVDTYVYYQGTSMATPHVAAVAALMKEANPAMTPANFDTYLTSGNITDDIGTAGRDNSFGYGLINAAKALNTAGSIAFPAVFAINPTMVGFTPGMTATTINVENGGTTAFTAPANHLTAYITGSGWLTVSPTSVDGSNLGTYQLLVDRTALADGEYSATVTFSATGVMDTVVNVTMKVGFDGNEDAGYHYFAIYNVASGKNEGYMEAVPAAGVYQYSFTGVPQGEYLIVAGTDMDNDYVFCDQGEACGSYSTTPLLVDRNLSGLNFVTSFSVPASGMQTSVLTGLVSKRGYPKQ